MPQLRLNTRLAVVIGVVEVIEDQDAISDRGVDPADRLLSLLKIVIALVHVVAVARRGRQVREDGLHQGGLVRCPEGLVVRLAQERRPEAEGKLATNCPEVGSARFRRL